MASVFSLKRVRDLDWLWLFLIRGRAVPAGQPIATDLRPKPAVLARPDDPAAAAVPRYTDPGGRRRSAMLATTGGIVGLGILLDCVFGQRILQFDESPQAQDIGWFTIARFGVHVPDEEFLFYAMAPIAIRVVDDGRRILARGLHAAICAGRRRSASGVGVDLAAILAIVMLVAGILASGITRMAPDLCRGTTPFSWCSRSRPRCCSSPACANTSIGARSA